MSYVDANNRQYTIVVTEPGVVFPTVDVELREADATGSEKQSADVRAIRVLLVDDHVLLREGLRQLLALEKDIQVVGEASDGFDALQKVRQLQPDVVLMDIHMPVVDGVTLTRQITHQFPSVAVIMLTMYRQSRQMLQAMKNGARGYLVKSASAREVAETIRTVYGQGASLQPGITQALLEEFRRLSSTVGEQVSDLLSEKEIEIIRYLAVGMSNKEIAEKLAYSEKTVKNYLTVIFQKLHLRDRTQVAIFALRNGLLPDDDFC
jgi:DNA-binding NarL/FixJ family response regulator